MYFDTTYLAKFYLNEPDSVGVRQLMSGTSGIHTSALAGVELHVLLHRRIREGLSSAAQMRRIAELFHAHCGERLWHLIPVTEQILRRTGAYH